MSEFLKGLEGAKQLRSWVAGQLGGWAAGYVGKELTSCSLVLVLPLPLSRPPSPCQTSEHTVDPGALQKGEDFIRAFVLGFEVQDSVALLRLDDLYVSPAAFGGGGVFLQASTPPPRFSLAPLAPPHTHMYKYGQCCLLHLSPPCFFPHNSRALLVRSSPCFIVPGMLCTPAPCGQVHRDV